MRLMTILRQLVGGGGPHRPQASISPAAIGELAAGMNRTIPVRLPSLRLPRNAGGAREPYGGCARHRAAGRRSSRHGGRPAGELGVGDAFSGVVIDGRFCHGELALAEIRLYEGRCVTPARGSGRARGAGRAGAPRHLRPGGRAAVPWPPSGSWSGATWTATSCSRTTASRAATCEWSPAPAACTRRSPTWNRPTAPGWRARASPSRPRCALGAVFEAGDVAFTLAAPRPAPRPSTRCAKPGRLARSRSTARRAHVHWPRARHCRARARRRSVRAPVQLGLGDRAADPRRRDGRAAAQR